MSWDVFLIANKLGNPQYHHLDAEKVYLRAPNPSKKAYSMQQEALPEEANFKL